MTRSAKTLRATAISALAAAGAIAIAEQPACTSSKSTAVGADAGTVVIGVVTSLTGDQGQTGIPVQSATQVAAQQLNAIGGILGRPVSFVILDDATNNDQTASIVNGFIQQKVAGVLGPTSSAAVSAVQKLLYDAKFIQISSTATSPTLSAAQPLHDRYLFRTIAPNDRMATVLAKFAHDGGVPLDGGAPPPTCRTMAIVHSDDSFGKSFADSMTTAFTARGGTVPAAMQLQIPATLQANYNDQVDAIVAASPAVDCMALLMFAPAATQLMSDFRKRTTGNAAFAPNKFLIVASNSEYSASFTVNGRANPADPASPTSVEGVYGVYVDPAPQTREYFAFQNLYTSMFQVDLSQGVLLRSTANQYDAAILLALAIEAAGGTDDRVKLRDALYAVSKDGKAYGPGEVADAIAAIKRGDDIDYNGASGPVDLGDDGLIDEDFVIWRVVDGNFVTVAHVKAADAK